LQTASTILNAEEYATPAVSCDIATNPFPDMQSCLLGQIETGQPYPIAEYDFALIVADEIEHARSSQSG
jgi:hypothetical protein